MRQGRTHARRSRQFIWLVLAAVLALIAAIAAIALYAQQAGVAPRMLAPYVEKRSTGHNPAIVALGRVAHDALITLDRGPLRETGDVPLMLGAQPDFQRSPEPAPGRSVRVNSSDAARQAIALAEPGDAIILAPGRYRFGRTVDVTRPGSAAGIITVRAEQYGTVNVEFDGGEGFRVAAPYWTFENLSIRGTCADDGACEHAFHVVGAASYFSSINNAITDFNAHFKINGEKGRFPDHGLIDRNTLTNTRARRTTNPVTPIDLVAASEWAMRRNLISDFIKTEGDMTSYGAFAKGAGSHNLFEQNIVWCERHLQGLPGRRVGLSFGGGGTGTPYCRDGRCITEQQGGIIRSNLIAACSDVGIYLNSAAQSAVLHNTVIDTAGIEVRFPTSSADFDGNLVDGAIFARNGGVLRLQDNRTAPIAYSYLGYHPVRSLFTAPAALDLGWKSASSIPRVATTPAFASLCQAARAVPSAYGAFDDFSPCARAPAPVRASSVTSSSSIAN
jgi:hypothetical protein